jgi:putative DNA primase/helicase
VKPWGRFERWSDMVRSPLVWLDCIDPCASIRMIEQDDPERTTHVQVMRAWFALFESTAKTCRQVLDTAAAGARLEQAPEQERKLAEVLRDVAVHRDGTWNTKKLGHWLRKLDGRIASGLKIMKEDGPNGDHTGLWMVKEAKETK